MIVQWYNIRNYLKSLPSPLQLTLTTSWVLVSYCNRLHIHDHNHPPLPQQAPWAYSMTFLTLTTEFSSPSVTTSISTIITPHHHLIELRKRVLWHCSVWQPGVFSCPTVTTSISTIITTHPHHNKLCERVLWLYLLWQPAGFLSPTVTTSISTIITTTIATTTSTSSASFSNQLGSRLLLQPPLYPRS